MDDGSRILHGAGWRGFEAAPVDPLLFLPWACGPRAAEVLGADRRPPPAPPREGSFSRELYDVVMSQGGRVCTAEFPGRPPAKVAMSVRQLAIIRGWSLRRVAVSVYQVDDPS